MKSVFKYVAIVFFSLCLFLNVGFTSKASNLNVMTKTSDKLLGNFVESAYNVLYNRKSDLDGFTYWYEILGTGQATVKDFIKKFVLESGEFFEKTKLKKDFIDKLYKFILGREVDKKSSNFWINYIDEKILEYYKKEYPNSYKRSDILTLRWNINDSPKVVDEVVNLIMNSAEFSIRVSFMNVKLDDNHVMLSTNRTNPLNIFNSTIKNVNSYDYSNEEKELKEKAETLMKKLSLKSEAPPKNSIMSPLEAKILNYLGSNVSNVAISFYDIKTKESFDINGDILFKAGSVYKVPLNMVLYDLVQKGKINLNDTVPYVHEKHYESGSGLLQNYIVDETLPPKTYANLSKLSLINSDNIAANMLISGISLHANLYKEYGKLLGHTLNRKGNLFSTNEINEFLKKIYFNEGGNPYYERIIDYLKKSSVGVRLGKYIPDSIIANKYGSYDGNYHDVAIVFGNRPFILSVFTRNLPNAETIIAQVGKMVYER